MPRIASHFEKSFGTGAEQQTVEDLLILQHQRSQPTGQCEDHVQVAGREKFSSTCSDPAVPSSGLTLRAVAVPAAVIGDGGTMPATGTLIQVPPSAAGRHRRMGARPFYFSPPAHGGFLALKP